MKPLIAGEDDAARALAAALAEAGPEPALFGTELGGDRTTAGLAAALLEAEREIARTQPDQVLLADDSDGALAAALVALKLVIPVQATSAASEAPSANGRLIAQLAATYTPPG